ncbi:uncharacterized protein LOC108668540 isoform X2 [Hyalella azteca]|uniref:Uncharacterized protein LOC108668540 isoform X2 n=1 Tax=Hyalella azteca TaxID=294128 RepID=A0A8B7NCE6_HYAAZ|nr:uncharacterized protein LOC108668540 isoform X2 [Hyalella azteca]
MIRLRPTLVLSWLAVATFAASSPIKAPQIASGKDHYSRALPSVVHTPIPLEGSRGQDISVVPAPIPLEGSRGQDMSTEARISPDVNNKIQILTSNSKNHVKGNDPHGSRMDGSKTENIIGREATSFEELDEAEMNEEAVISLQKLESVSAEEKGLAALKITETQEAPSDDQKGLEKTAEIDNEETTGPLVERLPASKNNVPLTVSDDRPSEKIHTEQQTGKNYMSLSMDQEISASQNVEGSSVELSENKDSVEKTGKQDTYSEGDREQSSIKETLNTVGENLENYQDLPNQPDYQKSVNPFNQQQSDNPAGSVSPNQDHIPQSAAKNNEKTSLHDVVQEFPAEDEQKQVQKVTVKETGAIGDQNSKIVSQKVAHPTHALRGGDAITNKQGGTKRVKETSKLLPETVERKNPLAMFPQLNPDISAAKNAMSSEEHLSHGSNPVLDNVGVVDVSSSPVTLESRPHISAPEANGNMSSQSKQKVHPKLRGGATHPKNDPESRNHDSSNIVHSSPQNTNNVPSVNNNLHPKLREQKGESNGENFNSINGESKHPKLNGRTASKASKKSNTNSETDSKIEEAVAEATSLENNHLALGKTSPMLVTKSPGPEIISPTYLPGSKNPTLSDIKSPVPQGKSPIVPVIKSPVLEEKTPTIPVIKSPVPNGKSSSFSVTNKPDFSLNHKVIQKESLNAPKPKQKEVFNSQMSFDISEAAKNAEKVLMKTRNRNKEAHPKSEEGRNDVKNAKDANQNRGVKSHKSKNKKASDMMATIAIILITLITIVTIIGVYCKKLSFTQQRYGPLSTEEEDELPLYSRYEPPYDAWKQMS